MNVEEADPKIWAFSKIERKNCSLACTLFATFCCTVSLSGTMLGLAADVLEKRASVKPAINCFGSNAFIASLKWRKRWLHASETEVIGAC